VITNKGKDIIAKYLIGQAPAYASYIAIGCGAKPLDTTDTFEDYTESTELNFEMFRVPIVSRGYVNEEGGPKIVFTAELPTEERYEISEIGIYSAGANPSATGNDSRVLFSFSNRENWEQHDANSVTAINRYDENLSKPTPDFGDMVDTAAAEDVFQTGSSNPFFTVPERSARNERCRFLNNILAIRGDESDLSISNIDGKDRLIIDEENSKHIHVNPVGINLEKNAPNDLMKIAFSVIGKNLSTPAVQPDEVRIMVEFAPDDDASEYARFDAIVENGATYENNAGDESFVYPKGMVDFSTNRYYVVSRQLQELRKSTGFSWSKVSVVKIYATVLKDDAPSSDYFVCLDALRLDNVATENPIYGLTGYSPVKSPNAQTVLKDTNTKSFVEFRFAMGIDSGI
jgi:hypothetical protein